MPKILAAEGTLARVVTGIAQGKALFVCEREGVLCGKARATALWCVWRAEAAGCALQHGFQRTAFSLK
jgi:hypothetical protein